MSHTHDLALRLSVAERRPLSWVQQLKFAIVGASGYLVNLAVFAVLAEEIGAPYSLAAICAFSVSLSSNFLWNRFWTFGPSGELSVFHAARYLAMSLVGLLVNMAFLVVLVELADMRALYAQAIAVAVSMPVNFAGNRIWVLS